MVEESDELRHQAIEKREEVADDLLRLQLKLQETAHEATDWRRLVRSRPVAVLGTAVGVGAFLGLTLGSYLRVGLPGIMRRR
jgi:ElaB/YqjD/DUF883 family membrane-anchored ribosome-binding protein